MIKIRVYKDKQFLVFDFEDGRTVKYDFATKQSIGIKGKPVNGLQSQLSGMTIKELIDCCDDKKYAKFLDFVRKKNPYYICNIGSILQKVPRYSRFEQIFSAGFEDIVDDCNFHCTINDIPKSLIKVCQTRNVKISDNLLKFWSQNIDAHVLAYQLDYMSLTDSDILEIITAKKYTYDEYYRYIYHSVFNRLIDDFGYNAKSLLLYIDYLKTFEAIENMNHLLEELCDYANMMSTISEKYDRYPRNFLTTHKIACRNYNRLKKEFSEELFKKKRIPKYECTFGDYKFFYPQSTQDIKDEAVQQNNCVASYIDNVIDGKCHILFLRKKDTPGNSLVTIEVRNNKIVQAKGRFNRDVTDEEQRIINMWNKRFSNKENVA